MKQTFFNTAGLFQLSLIIAAIGQLADTGNAGGYTRDEAIRLAYQNNRELAIATLEVQKAISKLKWSGRLDNPEFEFSYSGDGFAQREGESITEIGFSQKFPVTARLKHETNLRKYQVILAEAEISEKRRELAGEVDLMLVELLATQEKQKVSRELVALNKKIVEVLKKQATNGEASSLDVMQATLAGRTLSQQAKSLEAVESQQRLDLLQTIGLAADTPFQVNQSFRIPSDHPNKQTSLEAILKQRPDYVLALAKVDEASAAVTLENAKRWQDVSVRLFIEHEDSVDEPSGLGSNTLSGFGISIPLPLRKRNQEGIEHAETNAQAASKTVDATRFNIESECDRAYQKRHDAWELARDASGELLQLAESNLEEFRNAYQQGQASLIQVQRAQEQVLELKTASLEFLADYHRADAELRLATGAYPQLRPSSK